MKLKICPGSLVKCVRLNKVLVLLPLLLVCINFMYDGASMVRYDR